MRDPRECSPVTLVRVLRKRVWGSSGKGDPLTGQKPQWGQGEQSGRTWNASAAKAASDNDYDIQLLLCLLSCILDILWHTGMQIWYGRGVTLFWIFSSSRSIASYPWRASPTSLAPTAQLDLKCSLKAEEHLRKQSENKMLPIMSIGTTTTTTTTATATTAANGQTYVLYIHMMY